MKTDYKIKKTFYSCCVKRIIDIILSLLIMLLLSWLYALIAVLVRIKLGKPILFMQERPGKIDPKTGKERIFKLIKFRTMRDVKDENGKMLPDSVRLTTFGSWLRKTSLDEIPEIINIIRGDMSLIGPRPLLVSYLPYYTKEERHRHDVRPGLSGLAQVSGRNMLDWDQRLAKDVEYVTNVTFLGDCRIIFTTIKQVINRENITVDTIKEGNLAEIRSGFRKEDIR